MLPDLTLDSSLLPVRDNDGLHFAATLKDAHHCDLILGPGCGDAASLDAQVHIASLATDEGLIGFDLATIAANLHHASGLQGEADAVKHEPRGLLSDAQSAGHLTRANTILRASNDPDGGKPFLQTQGRILKDGSNLRGELTLRMSTLALPLFLIRKPRNIGTTTSGASHAFRPTVRHHVGDAVVGVCEVDDGFLKGARATHPSKIGELS